MCINKLKWWLIYLTSYYAILFTFNNIVLYCTGNSFSGYKCKRAFHIHIHFVNGSVLSIYQNVFVSDC